MKDHPDVGRLDEYVDGSLDRPDAADLEGHLRKCTRCRAHVERSRSLMEELRALPREVAPPRDLRPAVTEAPTGPTVAEPRKAVPRWWPAAAAIAALLLGYGLLSVLSRGGTGGADAGTPGAAMVATDVIEPRLRRYEETSRELGLMYRTRRAEWPDATARMLDAQLEAVDRAIARTSEARASRPSDAFLHDMLLARYRTKVDLLRRAVAPGLE